MSATKTPTFFWAGQACVCDPAVLSLGWHVCTTLTPVSFAQEYTKQSPKAYRSSLNFSWLLIARYITAILVFHPWESHHPLAGSDSRICHLWNVLSLRQPCLLPHCATFWAWPPHLASVSFQKPQSLPVAAPGQGVLALGSPGCLSCPLHLPQPPE